VGDEHNVLEHATAELLDAASDRSRLQRIVERLESTSRPSGTVSDEAHGAPFVEGALASLATLGRVLMKAAPAPPSGETVSEIDRLAAALKAKRHALEIFRALSSGGKRPSELCDATNLRDMQVHRVLDWAIGESLLHRWTGDGSTHYGLNARGEAALDAVDELVWLAQASAFVRSVVRQRLLDGRQVRSDPASAKDLQVRRLVEITGLSEHQAARGFTEVARALDPAANSRLAAALRFQGAGEHKVFISPPQPLQPFAVAHAFEDEAWREEWSETEWQWARLNSLSESLVVRSTDRAGLPPNCLHELQPRRYWRDGEQLLLSDSIISVGSPECNPVTEGLLLEYEAPLCFRGGERWPELAVGNAARQLSSKHVHGALLRIFDERTSVSHFILAGLLPSGTYAACRYFHDCIEQLLEQFPDCSFAAVLTVHRSRTPRNQEPIPGIAAHRVTTFSDSCTGRLLGADYKLLPMVAESIGTLASAARLRAYMEKSFQKLDSDVAGWIASVTDDDLPPLRRARNLMLAWRAQGRTGAELNSLLQPTKDQQASRKAREFQPPKMVGRY
jgi:hypothetical protein